MDMFSSCDSKHLYPALYFNQTAHRNISLRTPCSVHARFMKIQISWAVGNNVSLPEIIELVLPPSFFLMQNTFMLHFNRVKNSFKG